jgi:hypothetical protein
MRESDIEKILVREVKRLGGRAYKWVSPGNDGVPDKIVIFPDYRLVFVELKTDTGKLSALQSVQIKRLMELGQSVEVVKGINGLCQLFQNYGYEEVSKAIDCKFNV